MDYVPLGASVNESSNLVHVMVLWQRDVADLDDIDSRDESFCRAISLHSACRKRFAGRIVDICCVVVGIFTDSRGVVSSLWSWISTWPVALAVICSAGL